MWLQIFISLVVLLVWATVLLTGAAVGWGIFFMACLGALSGLWLSQRRRQRRRAAHLLAATLTTARTYATPFGQTGFKSVLHDLQQRHPKRMNHLAEMPLYMLLGASRSGKRTFLQHSGLTFGGGELRDIQGCSWWVADECAVVMPTQWSQARQALATLRQHRLGTPLQGTLIILSMEDLLTLDEAHLQRRAQTLRQQVDILHAGLHCRAPVHLVLTQCDRVAGFAESFGGLQTALRNGLWGELLAADDAESPSAQVGNFLDGVVQGMHEQVLTLMTQVAASNRDRVYQFPQQLSTLRTPLLRWANVFFATAQGRRAAPQLRGLFVCSARTGSTAVSRLCVPGTSELEGVVPMDLSADGPYFTSQIFSQGILPTADYDLSVRPSAQGWARQASVAAAVLLTLLPWLPYSHTLRQIASVQRTIEAGVQQGADASFPEVASMDRLREQLDQLNAAAQSAPTLSLACGMDQSVVLAAATRKLYSRLLQDTVQKLADMAPMNVEGSLQKNPANDTFARRWAAAAASDGSKALPLATFRRHLNYYWAMGSTQSAAAPIHLGSAAAATPGPLATRAPQR